jgi:pectin methylesterase-like acyl-CoA thioesterase
MTQHRMPPIPLLLAALGVSAVVSAPSAVATQRRYRVDDDRRQCRNAEFTTIQAAVAAAPPGATVEVCPGIYRESVVVDKPLTLSGPGSGQSNPHGKSRGQGKNHGDDDWKDSRNFGSPNDPRRAAILDGQFTLDIGLDLLANNITVEGFTVQRYRYGIRTSENFPGTAFDATCYSSAASA